MRIAKKEHCLDGEAQKGVPDPVREVEETWPGRAGGLSSNPRITTCPLLTLSQRLALRASVPLTLGCGCHQGLLPRWLGGFVCKSHSPVPASSNYWGNEDGGVGVLRLGWITEGLASQQS